MQRRTFLGGLLAPPAFMRSAAQRHYSWKEIDRMLERGDVRGRLSKDDLPTPVLLLDLDLFERNVQKMVAHCRASQRALRPHGKTHKCPEIAKYLIQAGAVGACAAKLSEAETFARNGVTGLLVTTAIIGKHKIERAVDLAASHRDIIYSVDNAQNVRDLNDAAAARKLRLNLAIDLAVGGRTGIQPGAAALALAQLIASLPHLRLAGIQAYAGQASHTIGFAERRNVSRNAMAPAVETRRLLEQNGIPCPLLTAGSTGTYNIDSEIDGITELQPGSFVFMDVDYARIGGQSGPDYNDFAYALTVLSTVVSKPTDHYVIVDGGYKAFATDRPFGPKVKDRPELSYQFAGDEHGRISTQGPVPLNVGDRLEFIVPHCDPTVNLYDRIVCTRAQQIAAVWPISARGMSQ